MKTSKQLLPVALRNFILGLGLLFTFSSFRPAPDNDPNVGFYVDGVKVTELTCYSFENLTVVLPYNPNYDAYDKIVIEMFADYKEEGSVWTARTYKDIDKANAFNFIKGKYLVFKIFGSKDQHQATGFGDPKDGPIWRGRLYNKVAKKAGDVLMVRMSGSRFSGYTEKYYESCNCIQKLENFSDETLFQTEVSLKNRISKLFGGEVDMSQPCTATGTKVDFNNLGK